VLARSDAKHHVSVRQHDGDWIHAPGKCLAEENHVRANALVFYAQELSCPTKALTELQNTIITWKANYALQFEFHRR
jgi:hypothetical protein